MKLLRLTYLLLFPILLLSLSLRLLMTDASLTRLYSFLPLNESDGWSAVSRYELARASLNYLRFSGTEAEAVDYLLDLAKTPQEPLYTEMEIKHLVDVKQRVDWVVTLGNFALGFILITSLSVWLHGRKKVLLQLLKLGALLTLFLILGSLGFILVAWEWFFVTFHEVLFPAGNWTFSADSSLIRLFPETFWFTFGVAWVGLIGAIGFLVLLATFLTDRRT